MVAVPPDVQVEETMQGARYSLPRRGPLPGGILLTFIGVIFGGVGGLLVVIAAWSLLQGEDWSMLFLAAFATPFLLAGLAMIGFGMFFLRGRTEITLDSQFLIVSDGWSFFRIRRRRPIAKITGASVRSDVWSKMSRGFSLVIESAGGKALNTAKGYGTEILVPVAQDILTRLGIAAAPSTASGESADVPVLVCTAGLPHVPDSRPQNIPLSPDSGQIGGFVLLVIALLWNGFIAAIIGGWWADAGFSWWMLLVLGIFGTLGLLFLFAAIHKLMAQSRMHPPELTISAAPVFIGETVRMTFQQTPKRSVQINGVKVKIICRESATYRHGTDTTTVTHNVREHEITILEHQHASPQQPLSAEFEFHVPDDAMHTFVGGNNRINWVIETHTDIAGWPDYSRSVVFDVAARRVPQPQQAQPRRLEASAH